MQAYKTAARIERPGELHLAELPFRAGDEVDVILLRRGGKRSEEPDKRYPLRGKPLRYDRPFDSVAEDDWEVLR